MESQSLNCQVAPTVGEVLLKVIGTTIAEVDALYTYSKEQASFFRSPCNVNLF